MVVLAIKRYWTQEYEDETKIDEDLYSSNDESVYEQLDHEYHWIISLSQLQEYLQEVAVCKKSHSQLEVTEERSCRAGLGTKLHFKCNGPTVVSRPLVLTLHLKALF